MTTKFPHCDPPIQCGCCGQPVSDGKKGEFIDGKTLSGSWTYMCPKCYERYGTGLGTGKGQRWTLAEDGKFYKTEG
jgi:hypothetical protein